MTLTQDAFISRLERHLHLDDPVYRAAVVAKIQNESIADARRLSSEIERASLVQLRDPEWRRKHGLKPSTSSSPDPRSMDRRFRAGFDAGKAGKRMTARQIDDPHFRDGYVTALTGSQAAETRTNAGASTTRGRPLMPKTDLYRGLVRFPATRGRRVAELRSASDDGPPVMEGHFATFNDWTEIDSLWEGNFLEQIAPGAFKKTFREGAQSIRALFQHGRDPVIGNKPLGSIDTLEEDDIGAHYVVPLFDTTYNSDLIPALRAGVYGASFRFSVIQESIDNEPKKSAMNPNGIPQRTILELRLFEFGPVTFPAYANATAGLRSLSDEFRRAA